MANGRELSDTRAWVSRTKWAIPQAGVAAKPCRSNEGSTALRAENPKFDNSRPFVGAKRRRTIQLTCRGRLCGPGQVQRLVRRAFVTGGRNRPYFLRNGAILSQTAGKFSRNTV
jgi:hypothetical protein